MHTRFLFMVVVVFLTTCELASADNVLRVRNGSASPAYIVVQQEKSKTGDIDRWVSDVAVGESASLNLQEPNTNRVVVAFLPAADGKLVKILAVIKIDSDNFYFSGDALLILRNNGDSYYFDAPKFLGKSLTVSTHGKPTEVTKDDLDKLKAESDKKTFQKK